MNKSCERVITRFVANSVFLPKAWKIFLLKQAGCQIGFDSSIRHNVYFESSRISIGNHCFINAGTSLFVGVTSRCSITIGDYTSIGPNCTLACMSHEIGSHKQRAGNVTYQSICVGSGCWLGACVTVLPGVTIGDGCIIAAGSVVVKDTEPDCLYAGVPAVKKKKLYVSDEK